MFGLVSKKAYDDLALALECEVVHSKSKSEFIKKLSDSMQSIIENLSIENTCLKTANAELVKKLDAKEQMLKETTDRLFDLQLKVSSLESRWGKEASI